MFSSFKYLQLNFAAQISQDWRGKKWWWWWDVLLRNSASTGGCGITTWLCRKVTVGHLTALETPPFPPVLVDFFNSSRSLSYSCLCPQFKYVTFVYSQLFLLIYYWQPGKKTSLDKSQQIHTKSWKIILNPVHVILNKTW